MNGINKVILIGNLCDNPAFKTIQNGANCVATVSLATNETYRDQEGSRQDKAEFHRLVFWGRQAEIARDYLRRGSLVFVEGKLRTRTYQDRNGQQQIITEVQVAAMTMLGGKAEEEGARTGQPAQSYQQQAQGYPQPAPPAQSYQQAQPPRPAPAAPGNMNPAAAVSGNRGQSAPAFDQTLPF